MPGKREEGTVDVSAWLGIYLAERDRERADAADALLASLTEREQRLVREAAVMGFVLGGLGGKRETVPPDSHIVREVISSCRSASDIFPLLGADHAR